MEITKENTNVVFYNDGEKHTTIINSNKVELPIKELEAMDAEKFEDYVKNYVEFTKSNKTVFSKRLYSIEEISTFKENLVKKQMDEVPDVEDAYIQAQEKAKQIVKEAKDRMNMVHTQIKDLAAEVKAGKTAFNIEHEEVYEIPIGNQNCYFVKIGNNFRLVLKEDINNIESEKWYNKLNRNNELLLNGFFKVENNTAKAVSNS